MAHDDKRSEDWDREDVQPSTRAQSTEQPDREAQATDHPVQRGPSLSASLQRPHSIDWLKFNVSLFLAVAVGYAVTFSFANAFTPETGTAIISQFIQANFAFFLGLFLAPLVATVAGVKIGADFRSRPNVAWANSFIGAVVGFLLFSFLLFVLVLSQATGPGVNFGDLVGPFFGYAIGVGVTGGVATFVTRWAAV